MSKQLKLQLVLEALDQASAPLRGLNKQIAKQTKGLTASRQKLKSLESAYKGMQKTRMSMQARGQKISQQLLTGENAVQREIRQTTSLINKQKNALSKLQLTAKKSDRARRRWQQAEQHRANMSFTGAAGVGLGYTTKRAATGFFEPALQFEEAMSKVAALTRLPKNSQQFKALKAQADQLGAKTSFTQTQVAEGQAFLAMAGFNPDEIQAAMPSMLDLAKGSGLDLGQTADISSNILSAFKLKADQMNMVADTLAATMTRSNVDMSMLGESMKYVAPIANKVGASVPDVAAMVGLLGNIGIQGSESGTALRSMYNRMAAPPKDAADALDALNVTTVDAAGNLRPMADILAEVAESSKDLGSAKQLAYFKAIAGARAGAALSELVDQGGSAELQKFVQELKNVQGEAERIRILMEDNALGDIEKMKSAWAGLASSVLDGSNNDLRHSIQSLTALIDRTREWTKDNPKLTASILTAAAAVAALATAGGAILLLVAGLTTPILWVVKAFLILGKTVFILGKSFAWLFKAVLPILSKSLLLLGKSLLFLMRGLLVGLRSIAIAFIANPIGLILTGIAIAVYAIWRNWDKLVAFFSRSKSEIFADIKSAFMDLPLITDLTNSLSFAIEMVAAILRGDWGVAWEAAKSLALSAVDLITAPIRTLWKIIKWLCDALGIDLSAAFKVVEDIAIPIMNTIKSVVEGVLQGIETVMQGLGEVIERRDELAGAAKSAVGLGDDPHVGNFVMDVVRSGMGIEEQYGGKAVQLNPTAQSRNVTVTNTFHIDGSKTPQQTATAVANTIKNDRAAMFDLVEVGR